MPKAWSPAEVEVAKAMAGALRLSLDHLPFDAPTRVINMAASTHGDPDADEALWAALAHELAEEGQIALADAQKMLAAGRAKVEALSR